MADMSQPCLNVKGGFRYHGGMTARPTDDHFLLGIALIAGSAILWSFGGTIAKFITAPDSWTVVFWRSYFATVFLLIFMVLRDGLPATVDAFRNMGRPGLVVASCFCIASTSFVVALSYTTVANILLMQAGVPLLAALISWVIFREKTPAATWVAIVMVILGVGIMVSNTLTGKVSPIGDGLSLLIAMVFAIATVTTRRYSGIRMVPATTLAVGLAMVVSGFMARDFLVSWSDFAWLSAFGAINLGLGLALFTFGARMLPAAIAALVGVLEPVLGPIWVWLVHGEIPNDRTLLGGAVVFAALLAHLLYEFKTARRS
jgi:drug/metabolite transporter (DMT)-like permease